MGRIREIKKQVRHKEWTAMVSDCQASGKKVEEWCAENGIEITLPKSISENTIFALLNVLKQC